MFANAFSYSFDAADAQGTTFTSFDACYQLIRCRPRSNSQTGRCRQLLPTFSLKIFKGSDSEPLGKSALSAGRGFLPDGPSLGQVIHGVSLGRAYRTWMSSGSIREGRLEAQPVARDGR